MNPKYLRLASDLHLEGFAFYPIEKIEELFLPKDEKDSSSCLMLAGDICSQLGLLENFIKYVENRFQHVYFVPGNHEYYRHDFNVWNNELPHIFKDLNRTTFATDNVVFVQHENWRLAMGTLWADGGNSAIDNYNVEQSLNDFRVIKDGDKNFSVNRMKSLNVKHKNIIEHWVDTPFAGRTVVMTHHMPSYRLCHPRFGNAINGGFASNCDNILARDNHPDLWLNGHTHDRYATKMWDTLVVCNPTGYRGEWNNTYSSSGPAFIELDNLKVHGIEE